MGNRWVWSAAFSLGLIGMARAQEARLMEMIDGHAIVSLPVRGFEKLTPKDKLLAYHLYQATVAGRDINFDQNHRQNLSIRNLCEQILLHGEGIDREVLEDVATYLKLQFVSVGIYEKWTYAKFLPPKRLTYAKFKAAALRAAANGAALSFADGVSPEGVGAYVDGLQRIIFDPTYEPFNTSRSPQAGEDMITASAANFYQRGIRLADLNGFTDKYALNSKIVRTTTGLGEQVWRFGDFAKGVIPGGYAKELFNVAGHLSEASLHASPANARALRKLVEFYRTGDNELFRQYNVAWLAYDKPVIDTINGFIETYRDPREQKASWEGDVFFVDEVSSAWLRQVALKADAYEQNAPFDRKYKRSGVKPIANMVEVLVQAGDGGPISASGVNLPNEQAIRQKHGSKNVLLWNARMAREAIGGEKLLREFIWPEDQELIRKHGKAGIEVLVGFHEALGHASGKSSAKLKGDPKDHLPGYYSWLEEERADLLALHHAWDPMTFKIRKDWNEEAARALYKRYPTMELLNLAELPLGATAIEESHAVGGNFAVHYFMKKWGVVEQVKKNVDGKEKTFFVVRDSNIPKMRLAVAELLKELQRIKSEGDLAAIKKLAADYDATGFDPKLAAEIRERKRALEIPSYYAFVYPSLDLVMKGGKPMDVKLTQQTDFLRQQMSWSGYSADDLKRLPSWL